MTLKINEANLIKSKGMLFSEQLGIDLFIKDMDKKGNRRKRDSELFKWLLASYLFGKRISEGIARKTFLEFRRNRVLTPAAIRKAGWKRLVRILDDGGYARYDESTASRLILLSNQLLARYKGSLQSLHDSAKGSRDLEARLQDFKGVGDVTASIFLRELRTVWPKADPEPGERIKKTASMLGVDLKNKNRKTISFMRLEAALVRSGKQAR